MNKPTATQRTLYTPGRTRRKVWDARCNAECACEATAPTKPGAIAAVTELHAYLTSAPAPIRIGGCVLATTAPGAWWFELRSGTRTATSAGFAAATQAEALATVRRWYAEHADAQAFIAATQGR